MNAQDVVQLIGNGVQKALATNKLFLGVEVDAFENADIHPEYVTTVEVAKQLTAPDRLVSLETHMKELRKDAGALAWVESGMVGGRREEIQAILARYKFGKKDSRRLDILVRSSDRHNPPLLMVEAKLGVQNVAGVIQDIDRIVRLLAMYHDLQLLAKYRVYGGVVFHSMEEGNDSGAAQGKALGLLAGIKAYLPEIIQAKPWLSSKAGLLSYGATVQPIVGYTEHYDDGTTEDVFAKESFSFAPGLVLLGNAPDVGAVQL